VPLFLVRTKGLVGRFNDSLTDFVCQSLKTLPGKKEIWAVGERVQLLLLDIGFKTSKLFPVPGSVNAITPLVQQILAQSEEVYNKAKSMRFIFFIINQGQSKL
jgi:F-type H+-transporting ATPase subunit gamma